MHIKQGILISILTAIVFIGGYFTYGLLNDKPVTNQESNYWKMKEQNLTKKTYFTTDDHEFSMPIDNFILESNGKVYAALSEYKIKNDNYVYFKQYLNNLSKIESCTNPMCIEKGYYLGLDNIIEIFHINLGNAGYEWNLFLTNEGELYYINNNSYSQPKDYKIEIKKIDSLKKIVNVQTWLGDGTNEAAAYDINGNSYSLYNLLIGQ